MQQRQERKCPQPDSCTCLSALRVSVPDSAAPCLPAPQVLGGHSPILPRLAHGLLGHQQVVLLGRVALPVGQLGALAVALLRRRHAGHTGRGGRRRPGAPATLTLSSEACSLCSWSRYFSMLKKVSKKTPASLQRFRSLSVILPAGGGEDGRACASEAGASGREAHAAANPHW